MSTAVGEIGDSRAVEPLITALKDENQPTRITASLALGQIRDPRAVEPLIAALKDKDRQVPRDAAIALGQIRDPRAVEPLIAALKDKKNKDQIFQEEASKALMMIGTPEAIAALENTRKENMGEI